MKQEIFDNKQELAKYFGDYLAKLSHSKDHVTIALSGGSTPKAIFDVLSQEYRHQVDWRNLFFFWGDERCVPITDEESNYGMTRQRLFTKVGVDSEHVFRVKGELTPQEAMEDYTILIEENVPYENNLPQFDLMILGMGDDGHTASIFPHQIELWNSNNICEVAQHPTSGQHRITLSGKVINNAREIFFLVTGDNKAEKAKEIITKTGDHKSYPAALVDKNKSIWLMDKEAAKLL